MKIKKKQSRGNKIYLLEFFCNKHVSFTSIKNFERGKEGRKCT